MATENVLADDLARILAPISEEQPAGADLRKGERSVSQSFYDVRDARNKASKAEKLIREFNMLTDEEKEMEHATPESPDWNRVKETAIETLSTKTKDLWVAAWLVEALVRLHGFAGIRDGYRLVRELCAGHWGQIHPQPEEGEDLRHTVAQLAGLNGEGTDGTLIRPISEIPITEDAGGDGYSSADYVDACDLENKDPEIRSQRIAQGMPTLEMFDRAVNDSTPEFYLNMIDDILEAIAEFNQLTEFLDEHCGTGSDSYSLSPPSSNISGALVDCMDRIKSVAKHVMPVDESEMIDPETGELVPAGKTEGSNNSVQNREDAFRALLHVAEFFRRTEPHSPVSYALEQAVRWGRMSLPELMAELVTDESARRQLFQRTGISPIDSDES